MSRSLAERKLAELPLPVLFRLHKLKTIRWLPVIGVYSVLLLKLKMHSVLAC